MLEVKRHRAIKTVDLGGDCSTTEFNAVIAAGCKTISRRCSPGLPGLGSPRSPSSYSQSLLPFVLVG